MNCNLIKFCCIPVLLFFINSFSFAQNNNREIKTDTAITSVEEDSIANDNIIVGDTVVTKTLFDGSNDSILKWKQSRDFGYMAYLDSLLKKKKNLRIDTVSIDNGAVNKSKKRTGSSNSNSFLNSLPVKIFFWLIAFFFIGFILYKLFFTGGLFAKKIVKLNDERATKEPESLNEYVAYNLLIHEAESKNDFNLAIRYLYLQSLKTLADSEVILFSPDKTNNSYVQELSDYIYQHEFASLTGNYEYIWYGKFLIDGTRYQKLKEQFILFNKKI